MTELPRSFRRIRLALAREKDHPTGSHLHGYEFAAPLDEQGRIDPEIWKKHREACRVRRFRPGEADDIGHLVRKPGGSWAFRYDIDGDEDDEPGHRLGEERFAIGEYVSFYDDEDEEMHAYQVVSVEPV